MNSEPFKTPQVDPSAYIARGAIVFGDVHMAADCSVWFNAVLRSDTETIRIGPRSNVQDGAVLHADPGYPCIVGSGVTIGHGAIVHGCTLEDDVLIGMRAVVMNGARIGRGSIVGVGAVVTEGTQVPPGSLVLGIPGKIKRPATEDDLMYIHGAAEHYVQNAKRFREQETAGKLPFAEERGKTSAR